MTGVCRNWGTTNFLKFESIYQISKAALDVSSRTEACLIRLINEFNVEREDFVLPDFPCKSELKDPNGNDLVFSGGIIATDVVADIRKRFECLYYSFVVSSGLCGPIEPNSDNAIDDFNLVGGGACQDASSRFYDRLRWDLAELVTEEDPLPQVCATWCVERVGYLENFVGFGIQPGTNRLMCSCLYQDGRSPSAGLPEGFVREESGLGVGPISGSLDQQNQNQCYSYTPFNESRCGSLGSACKDVANPVFEATSPFRDGPIYAYVFNPANLPDRETRIENSDGFLVDEELEDFTAEQLIVNVFEEYVGCSVSCLMANLRNPEIV